MRQSEPFDQIASRSRNAGRHADLTAEILPNAATPFLCFSLGLAAQASSLWQVSHLGLALLNPAQAVLIAILLRSQQRHQPGRIAAGSAGLALAGAAFGLSPTLAAGLAAASALQALLAATCVRAILKRRAAEITRTIPCAVILMCGGILAPVAGSIIALVHISVFGSAPLAVLWLQGGIADAVGVLVCLPALLSCKSIREVFGTRRMVALACVGAAASLTFNLHLFVQPILLLPVLVYTCFIDFGTATLALPVAAASILLATTAGTSPFGIALASIMLPGLLVAQVFLLTASLIVLPLALALEQRARLAALGDASLDQAMREAAEKSRFIAVLSHEIRAPLNGIVGFADLLGATPLTAEQAAYLRRAQQAAATLLAMVNDLLDLSKIQSGRVKLRSCTFNLRRLCNDVLDVLRATPDAHAIDLGMTIDPALPERVEGDPVRLQQILLNLVANALAHTARGSVRLEIAPVPGQPDHIRFRVTDTGSGIPPEQLKDLFRPFSQLNDPAAKRNGTGLGLSICKDLVEQMPGGAIGVQSRLGQGSTFWFILALPEGAPGITPRQVTDFE